MNRDRFNPHVQENPCYGLHWHQGEPFEVPQGLHSAMMNPPASGEYVVFVQKKPVGLIRWAPSHDDFGPAMTPTELAKNAYGHLRGTRQKISIKHEHNVKEWEYDLAKEVQWENQQSRFFRNNPRLQNADTKIRKLERAVAAGEPGAELRLEREQVRIGQLPYGRIYLRDALQRYGVPEPSFRDLAKALRKFLKKKGVKAISIKVPTYSMANTIDITPKKDELHFLPADHQALSDIFLLQVSPAELPLHPYHREDRSNMQTDYWHPAGPQLTYGDVQDLLGEIAGSIPKASVPTPPYGFRPGQVVKFVGPRQKRRYVVTRSHEGSQQGPRSYDTAALSGGPKGSRPTYAPEGELELHPDQDSGVSLETLQVRDHLYPIDFRQVAISTMPSGFDVAIHYHDSRYDEIQKALGWVGGKKHQHGWRSGVLVIDDTNVGEVMDALMEEGFNPVEAPPLVEDWENANWFENPYHYRTKNGRGYVVNVEPLWSDPIEKELWWPVTRSSGFADEGEEIQDYGSGDGDFYGSGGSRISIDPSAEAVFHEEREIHPPKTKMETRWRDGRWQKLYKSGWKDHHPRAKKRNPWFSPPAMQYVARFGALMNPWEDEPPPGPSSMRRKAERESRRKAERRARSEARLERRTPRREVRHETIRERRARELEAREEAGPPRRNPYPHPKMLAAFQRRLGKGKGRTAHERWLKGMCGDAHFMHESRLPKARAVSPEDTKKHPGDRDRIELLVIETLKNYSFPATFTGEDGEYIPIGWAWTALRDELEPAGWDEPEFLHMLAVARGTGGLLFMPATRRMKKEIPASELELSFTNWGGRRNKKRVVFSMIKIIGAGKKNPWFSPPAMQYVARFGALMNPRQYRSPSGLLEVKKTGHSSNPWRVFLVSNGMEVVHAPRMKDAKQLMLALDHLPWDFDHDKWSWEDKAELQRIRTGESKDGQAHQRYQAWSEGLAYSHQTRGQASRDFDLVLEGVAAMLRHGGRNGVDYRIAGDRWGEVLSGVPVDPSVAIDSMSGSLARDLNEHTRFRADERPSTLSSHAAAVSSLVRSDPMNEVRGVIDRHIKKSFPKVRRGSDRYEELFRQAEGEVAGDVLRDRLQAVGKLREEVLFDSAVGEYHDKMFNQSILLDELSLDLKALGKDSVSKMGLQRAEQLRNSWGAVEGEQQRLLGMINDESETVLALLKAYEDGARARAPDPAPSSQDLWSGGGNQQTLWNPRNRIREPWMANPKSRALENS